MWNWKLRGRSPGRWKACCGRNWPHGCRCGASAVAEWKRCWRALSGQTPPPSLARIIFDETEGNPFFVEEVFRHLAEEGKLFDEQRCLAFAVAG